MRFSFPDMLLKFPTGSGQAGKGGKASKFGGSFFNWLKNANSGEAKFAAKPGSGKNLPTISIFSGGIAGVSNPLDLINLDGKVNAGDLISGKGKNGKKWTKKGSLSATLASGEQLAALLAQKGVAGSDKKVGKADAKASGIIVDGEPKRGSGKIGVGKGKQAAEGIVGAKHIGKTTDAGASKESAGLDSALKAMGLEGISEAATGKNGKTKDAKGSGKIGIAKADQVVEKTSAKNGKIGIEPGIDTSRGAKEKPVDGKAIAKAALGMTKDGPKTSGDTSGANTSGTQGAGKPGHKTGEAIRHQGKQVQQGVEVVARETAVVTHNVGKQKTTESKATGKTIPAVGKGEASKASAEKAASGPIIVKEPDTPIEKKPVVPTTGVEAREKKGGKDESVLDNPLMKKGIGKDGKPTWRPYVGSDRETGSAKPATGVPDTAKAGPDPKAVAPDQATAPKVNVMPKPGAGVTSGAANPGDAAQPAKVRGPAQHWSDYSPYSTGSDATPETVAAQKVPGAETARPTSQPLFSQLEEGLKQAYILRPKSVTVKLSPEELGDIKVRVSVENEQLSAKIQTENARVTSIIKDNQSNLEHRLREQGIELERFDVSEDSPDRREQGQSDANGSDAHGQQPFAGHSAHGGTNGEAASENQEQANRTSPQNQPLTPGQPLNITI